MQFGKNIKKIRSIKKLSQASFAEIFDITRSSVGAYEEQRAEPKLELVSRIAKHFSISVDSLINREVTVNELSHFNLYQNIGSELVSLKEASITIGSVPMIKANNLITSDLNRAIGQAEHKISLPNLDDNDVAIYIDSLTANTIADDFSANDIIIVKNRKNEIDTLSGKICLVKYDGKLFAGELLLAGKKEMQILNTNLNPYTMLKSKIDFALPVEAHISKKVVVRDTTTEKIKKLEFMVNHLYNKLE